MRDRLADPAPQTGDIVNDPTSPWHGAEVTFAYTRAMAIADGVLVDVSEMAREAGIRIPVALTDTVWEDCCEWTDDDSAKSRAAGQSPAGRLWDVLAMLAFAIRANSNTDRLLYELRRHPRPGRGRSRLVTLKAVIGPGDHGEPVITIMQPSED